MSMRHLLRTARANALLAVAIVLMATASFGTVNTTTYTVATSATPYVPLAGGTQIVNLIGDDSVSTPIDIGFDFYYDGTRFTQFNACTNGYMSLNPVHTTATAANVIATTAGAQIRPIIAPLWDDMSSGAETVYSFRTTGSAPNRVFTYECLNAYWNFSATAGVISYQVRLFEGTGAVEFHYRPEGGAVAGASASCGISGVAVGAGNFISMASLTVGAAASSAAETTTIAAKPVGDLLISFTPAAMSDGVTGLNAVAPAAPAGGTQIDLSWTNPTDPDHFSTAIFQSDDLGANFRFRGMVNAPANTISMTGLGWASEYRFIAVGISHGGVGAASNTATTSTQTGTSPTLVTVSGGIGDTLTSNIAAMATAGLAGPTTIELSAAYVSTNETFPIVLPGFAGRSTPVTVRPAAGAVGRVIASNNAGNSAVRFIGSHYLTLDGRPGGVGGMSLTDNLTVRNNNAVATNATNAIALFGEGWNNTIRYCNLLAANAGTGTAPSGCVISISPTGLANPHQGLDNTTIEFNNIGSTGGATFPARSIICFSPTVIQLSLENSMQNLVIANNNIYDFFYAGTTGNVHGGIICNIGHDRMIIEGNRFGQTAARTGGAGITSDIRAIAISAFGGGNIIRNNIIGPNPLTGTGTWTMGGAVANRMQVITANGGWPKNEVYGNQVSDIVLTSSSTGATNAGIFAGIMVFGGGDLDIGVAGANTIGSQTAAGNITVTHTGAGGVEAITAGICLFAAGRFDIRNNLIGGLSMDTTTATSNVSTIGIHERTRGNGISAFNAWFTSQVNISANTIGGTVAGSLHAGDATDTTGQNHVYGIRIEPLSGTAAGAGATGMTGTFNVDGNIVRNLSNTKANDASVSAAVMRGITAGVSGSALSWPAMTIFGNTVQDLAFGVNNTAGVDNTAPLIGIADLSAAPGQLVSLNTVSNVRHVPPAAGAALISRVSGIHLGTTATSTGNSVARNLVHGLNNGSTNVGSVVAGISNLSLTDALFENNMVRLGLDTAGADITSGTVLFAGLSDRSAAARVNNWNHNSVLITGTGVGTGSTYSTAFLKNTIPATPGFSVRNNILMNTRENGAGTGTHYAAVLENSGVNMDMDFNVLFHAGGAGQAVGGINATTPSVATTLGQWQIDSNEDLNSRFNNPLFVAASAATPNLHIQSTSPSAVEHLTAPVIATVDFDGQTRASFVPANVDLGADAGAFDTVAPLPVMNSVSGDPTADDPIAVTVTFAEAVTGFDATDVAVGGTATFNLINFTGAGASYGFDLDYITGGPGSVSANIAGGACIDGSGNPNGAATPFTRNSTLPVELSAFGLE